MADIFVIDALRTPRGLGHAPRDGKPGGALSDVRPIELVATLLRAIPARLPTLDLDAIDDLILGINTQSSEQGANLARTAALFAGWPPPIAGATINRFCASGFAAITDGAARIAAGFDDIIVAGGVESMSRVPVFSDAGPWFADPEVATRTRFVHMGVAADLCATLGGIDRDAIDALAVESHRRAHAATATGRFNRSLVPVSADGADVLTHDEAIRTNPDLARFAALPAAFAATPFEQVALDAYPELDAVEHPHSVGSAPALADAASLVVLASAAAVARFGLTPRARITGAATVGSCPVAMLTGTAPAIRRALRDRSPASVDEWEINESFAATPLLAAKELGVEVATMNRDGGAIAMGHPLGATGGILTATLLDRLDRENGQRGVAAIPAGGGLASALVFERD